MADNPCGRAIPTPCGFVALQMDTAEPSIDAVQVNVVCPTFNDVSSCLCERHVTKAVLGRVRYLNERMANIG